MDDVIRYLKDYIFTLESKKKDRDDVYAKYADKKITTINTAIIMLKELDKE